jgi:hypothetical protein
MAGKRISELAAAAALDGSELIELVQAGANVKGAASSFVRVNQLGTGWVTALAEAFATIMDTYIPIGIIKPWPGIAVPNATNWAFAQGGALSRATYATLYGRLTSSLGAVDISIATPGVVTLAAHGLATGDRIELTTTGALPTGLAANTNYWVIYVNASTFSLATTLANALAGTKINTSGSQSGVHTLRYCPWGTSGATDFLLPDSREAAFYGIGTRAAEVTAHDAAVLGQFKDDQGQGHFHEIASLDQPAIGAKRIAGYGAGANIADGDCNLSDGSRRQARDVVTDGSNGTPRIGTVTRGKILGVNYIIRIA